MSQGTPTTETVLSHAGEPGESKPAPGALALVQAFINTVDLLEVDREQLSDAASLSAWFTDRDLIEPDTPVSTRDLQRALELREALRAFLIANAGGQLDPDALAVVNRAVEAADLTPTFASDATASLQPKNGGVDGALGTLLAIVFAAMADGSWSRLKACRYYPCRWAYYDASKNRSGTWCSMSSCGNKVKTRAYRARRAQ
jgi:predicted RNA-binding Zn ribbon-like protein